MTMKYEILGETLPVVKNMLFGGEGVLKPYFPPSGK